MGTRQSLHRRTGVPSVAEQNLVTALVLDSPTEVKPGQVMALAKALRRSPAAIKSMIEKAQESFRSKAQRYVDVHMEATELALAGGTVAGLEVAQKGAQWALERMSGEGVRLIEPKPGQGEGGPAGPRVMIGIQLGGLDATKPPPVDATITEVKLPD